MFRNDPSEHCCVHLDVLSATPYRWPWIMNWWRCAPSQPMTHCRDSVEFGERSVTLHLHTPPDGGVRALEVYLDLVNFDVL
jgi:hypothetical protein